MEDKLNKSVVAFDTPEACNECPLYLRAYKVVGGFCFRTKNYVNNPDEIASWCPAKKLHGLMVTESLDLSEQSWVNGYNARLKEIL